MELNTKDCYIAGKISGLSEEEYTSNFLKAKEEVLILGLNPINPVELNHDHDKSWLSYMREDLSEMLKCSHVYALSNWEDSRGAKVEVTLAKELGISVIYQK